MELETGEHRVFSVRRARRPLGFIARKNVQRAGLGLSVIADLSTILLIGLKERNGMEENWMIYCCVVEFAGGG